MATAIAKRQTAKLDQADRDELLRLVLTRQPGSRPAWDKLAADGANDPEITAAIAAALGEAGSLTDDAGRACCWALTFGNPIYFGTVKIPKRAADIEGYRLVMKCRGLFGIEMPKGTPSTAEVQESFSAPRTNGHARNGKAHANGMGNGQLPIQNGHAPTPPAAGRLAIVEEVEIRIEAIKPSPENPREDYDQAFLEQLGQSILDHGLLTPLLVRNQGLDGKYEIIDGETRWRAATLKKIPGLRCSVVECTDAEAAIARLLSYRQRRDLNPIEEARGIQLCLQKYGCSQRELEAKIGVSQGQISNLTRLLKLPDVWQKRVISGEISGVHARELAAWNDEPAVAGELEKIWKQKKGEIHFSEELCQACCNVSDELGGYDWQAGGDWKLDLSDPAVKAELRIKKLKNRWGRGEERAFNVKLAKQLKAAAIAKLKAKANKKTERAEASAKSAPTAAQKRERQKQLADQLNKKIYRYKIGWLQQRILRAFADGKGVTPHYDQCVLWLLWFAGQEEYHRRAGELFDAIGAKANSHSDNRKSLDALQSLCGQAVKDTVYKTLAAWLSHTFEGWRTDLKPWMIESFALQIGTDFEREWKLDEDFLELFTKDGLLELVDEWKLGVHFLEKKKGAIVATSTLAGLKRQEIIDQILALDKVSKLGLRPPKCLLKVKEVSLT